MIEAMKRWRDTLAATRIMGPDEQGNYTRELTPKATLDAIAEMDAAIKAAGEPTWFLTEQGQLFATRGSAERMAVGQKITPLYTHPAKRLTGEQVATVVLQSLPTYAARPKGADEREHEALVLVSWSHLRQIIMGAMGVKE